MEADGDTQLTSYNSFLHFGHSDSLLHYRTACYWSAVQMKDKGYFNGRLRDLMNMGCCLLRG